MSHRLSRTSYIKKCLEEKEDEYASLAEKLKETKELTIYFRESVKTIFQIEDKELRIFIFDSKGEMRSGNIICGFEIGDNFVTSMIFEFAEFEAEAHEIYNEDHRTNSQ